MSLVLLAPGRGRRVSRPEAGFTLLELLVVLAILGLLIGLVAPRVLGVFGTAKEKVVRLNIAGLGTELDMYKLDVGSYPTTEQGLQALLARPAGVADWDGPYIKGTKMPDDPWGHPYVYRSPSERAGFPYDLYSLGPSGQTGGSGRDAPIYNQ
ncbi:MAG: type II secretion system major pseudopilin GspG [Stellaceae bacterium]